MSAASRQTAFDTTLPVPESLLVPLLDDAAKVLTKMASTGDAPPALRALVGFDPRKLGSGPARLQLRRALDVDEAFRHEVVARFEARPGVDKAIAGWSVDTALERVTEASVRSDLPLLASALYALRPTGWTFGLGAICAAAERDRADREQTDDAKAWEVRLGTVEEARRRADEGRDEALADVARLETELRDQRAARRTREQGATDAVDDAERRRRDAETVAEQATARADTAESRLAREAARARTAEHDLRMLRREVDAQARADADRPAGLTRDDLDALAAAAEHARKLTASLDGLTRRARDQQPEPRPDPDPAAVVKRKKVPSPPGMLSDTTEALDTMIRTRGVVLVIDGYNVSMTGWPDAPPLEQRERLLAALERLHLRVRCDVIVVFDGADVEAVPTPRRSGVRVVFSDAGEEADPVVVREVAARPKRVPVIVVSSDGWVKEHAEAEGATVAPKETLLALLRQ